MDFYEQIETYKLGKLSGADLQNFEQAMKDDAELKLLVENYDAVKEASRGILEMDLLHQVESIAADVNGDASPKTSETTTASDASKRRNLRPFLIGILIGCMAGYFLFFHNKNGSTENSADEILMAHYDRPIPENLVRSGEVKEMNLLDQGQYYFELNDFQKAQTSLQAQLKNTSNADTIAQSQFWLAHALLNAGDYDQAEKAFLLSSAQDKQKLITLARVLAGKESVDVLD